MTATVERKHSFVRIMVLSLVLLVALFGLAGVCGDGPAFAASKAKLTKTKVTVRTGDKTKLTVKKANKKVRWTTSDKKKVSIVRKTGKYKQTVVLKAGKKTGSCWIKAKVGKKTLKCKVTVKKKAGQAGPEVLPLSDSSVDLAKGYSFSPAADTGSSDAFDQAYTDFAVRLLQATLKEDTAGGNVLISPDSVMTALTMTENGAGGKTLEEMQKTLTGTVSPAEANEYLFRMHSRLAGSKEVIYTNSNSIWAREGLIKAAPAFLQTNKRYFNASFYEAPFNEETVSDMNRWVYNNTRNKIKQIIDPASGLSGDARLVLINAVAFEGAWPRPLTSVDAASEKVFTCADQTEQTVNMLKGSGTSYLKLAGGRGFCENYANGEVAFMGLLPPEGMSARDYAAKLTAADLRAAWKDRKEPAGGVIFHVPQFSYDYDASMKDVLIGMGMEQAFTGNADFSAMVDPDGPDPEQTLLISDVLHKTHISLDEIGTQASAATAVIMEKATSIMDPPQPERVYLDRPFVYGLIDTKTGNPLFLGIVEKIN